MDDRRRPVLRALAAVLLLAATQPASADDAAAPTDRPSDLRHAGDDDDAPRVRAVRVHGLDRTSESVVRRELGLEPGDVFVAARLDEGVQRLKNLRIFRRVEARVRRDGHGEVDLDLEVAEKWTTIPVIRFGGGGGTHYLILGAYDINTAGRYVEVGGQYENIGGAHSGVLWFRNPRLLDRFLLVTADVRAVTRTRRLYTRQGELEGAFTLHRKRVHMFGEHELHRYLHLGGGLSLDVDRFSERNLGPEDLAANQMSGAPLPDGARTVLVRATARAGRLDHDDYLVGGATARLTWERAVRGLGSELALSRLLFEGTAGLRLPGTSNVAARVVAGATSTTAPQHLFYVGGLDYLRGFSDGQFRGAWCWLANLEYRVSSLATPSVVVQHTAFVDVGQVADTASGLVASRRPPLSTGLGVRLLSPRIYRLVLRLDYAFAFGERRSRGLSFGVQQFF